MAIFSIKKAQKAGYHKIYEEAKKHQSNPEYSSTFRRQFDHNRSPHNMFTLRPTPQGYEFWAAVCYGQYEKAVSICPEFGRGPHFVNGVSVESNGLLHG